MLWKRNPDQGRRGSVRGIVRQQTLESIFGPQILGRYKLWGPDLVTDATVVESPSTFNAAPWGNTGVTFSDAYTLRETADTNFHTVSQDLSNAIGPVTSVSVDVEADGRDILGLQLKGSASNSYSTFLLGAGTGGTTVSGCTVDMENLGAGRWRATIYPTVPVDSGTATLSILSRKYDSFFAYAGDITKGLKLYNAQINQTSILTAPNDPTLAARNLALYGDPYHYTNPNKSSQLVVGADVWNGLPGAIASGANWIACDEMAARYTGEDKQIFVAVSVQSATLGASDYIVGLGNSADNNPHQALGTGAGPNWGAIKDDNVSSGPVTNTSTTACDGNRHILAWSHDGKTETIWLDGVVTSISAAASDLGAMTVDQVTLFALRKIAAANHAPVIARDVVMGMAANPAQMLAGYNLMRAENPL